MVTSCLSCWFSSSSCRILCCSAVRGLQIPGWPLCSAVLRQPTADRRLADAHASAGVLDALPLLFDHSNHFQLQARVESPPFSCCHVLRWWIFHLLWCPDKLDHSTSADQVKTVLGRRLRFRVRPLLTGQGISVPSPQRTKKRRRVTSTSNLGGPYLQKLWRIPKSKPEDEWFGAVTEPLIAVVAPPSLRTCAYEPYNAVRLDRLCT
jgi:hypothetical protein